MSEGNSPLMNAVMLSYPHAVYTLICNGADVNYRNPIDGNTALYYSVLNRSVYITLLLMCSRAAIGIPNNHGVTPFNLCLKFTKDKDTFKLLCNIELCHRLLNTKFVSGM
jgi:ankyrin repeat protein